MSTTDSKLAFWEFGRFCGLNRLTHKGHGIVARYGKKYVKELEGQLQPDGTITYRGAKDHHSEPGAEAPNVSGPQPGDDLRKLLADAYEAIQSQELPIVANYRIAGDPPALSAENVAGTTFYPYYTGEGDEVAMVVRRTDFNDGTEKACQPFYFFKADNDWRCGEVPGRPNPLYGARPGSLLSQFSHFMVHEGEKACDAAKEVAADPTHPYHTFYRRFCHVSWQGGARGVMKDGGQLGHASAVDKADWSPINQSGNKIYIQADNDEAGRAVALQVRSKLTNVDAVYCLATKSLPAEFPEGWDIADPVPMKKETASADAKLVPASSVQDFENLFRLFDDPMYLDTSGGKPTWKVRRQFAEKFTLVRDLNVLVETDRPTVRYNEDSFNSWFSELVNDRLRNLYKHVLPLVDRKIKVLFRGGGTVEGDRWIPPSPRGSDGGETFINTFTPPPLTEAAPTGNIQVRLPMTNQSISLWCKESRFARRNPEVAERYLHLHLTGGKFGTPQDLSRAAIMPWRETEKSLRPFLVYLRHLIPNPVERKTLLRWMANNLTAPSFNEKARWATLLVSNTQGNGKTTLGKIIARLVGTQNCRSVSGTLLERPYTSWAEDVMAVTIEELMEESTRLYDRLKEPISNETMTMEAKYVRHHESTTPWLVLANSNHNKAMSLPNTDRRWFLPGVTTLVGPHRAAPAGSPEAKFAALVDRYLPGSMFSSLWTWLDRGGDRYLLWWLRRYGFRLHAYRHFWNRAEFNQQGTEARKTMWSETFDRAPSTDTKDLWIARSRPTWQTFLITNLPRDVPMIAIEDIKKWLVDNKECHPSLRNEELTDFLAQEFMIFVLKDNPESRAASADSGLKKIFTKNKTLRHDVKGHIAVPFDALQPLIDAAERDRAENKRGWPSRRDDPTNGLVLFSEDWTLKRDAWNGAAEENPVLEKARAKAEAEQKAADLIAAGDKAVF